MKKYFIVHAWGESPNSLWYKALQKGIQAKGNLCSILEMPETENPKIDAWVRKLQEVVPSPDATTYFIGHSVGCQAILRYLGALPSKVKIGGCIFFAPWFTLKDLEDEEAWAIAKPWLETPIDLGKVKSHCNSFDAFFSDNDPFVPIENEKMFREKLGAITKIMHQKGHFDGDDISNFPQVVKK